MTSNEIKEADRLGLNWAHLDLHGHEWYVYFLLYESGDDVDVRCIGDGWEVGFRGEYAPLSRAEATQVGCVIAVPEAAPHEISLDNASSAVQNLRVGRGVPEINAT
jgi:hypothetical protein